MKGGFKNKQLVNKKNENIKVNMNGYNGRRTNDKIVQKKLNFFIFSEKTKVRYIWH